MEKIARGRGRETNIARLLSAILGLPLLHGTAYSVKNLKHYFAERNGTLNFNIIIQLRGHLDFS